MKNLLLLILLSLGSRSNAQDTFQLATPLLRYPSVYFTKEVDVEIAFGEPNTQIRYTLNGQDPNENAALYTKPVRISKHFTTLKARVFSKNYLPSDVVEATFIKDGLRIKSVDNTQPNDQYKGSGTTTLIDNKGGTTNISGKTWLGFLADTVEIIIKLHKKEKVKKVLVNLLEDQGSWIFLPQKIEVFAFNDESRTFQRIESTIINIEKNTKGACVPKVFTLKKGVKTDTIKIQLHLVQQIPDWHPGKGNKGWIFIDEVKVYDK
jgi:hypothetical protein